MPYLNTACMKGFWEAFAQWLEGRKALIVMDRAGWHRAKALTIPKHREPILLPGYCPELNPVER